MSTMRFDVQEKCHLFCCEPFVSVPCTQIEPFVSVLWSKSERFVSIPCTQSEPFVSVLWSKSERFVSFPCTQSVPWSQREPFVSVLSRLAWAISERTFYGPVWIFCKRSMDPDWTIFKRFLGPDWAFVSVPWTQIDLLQCIPWSQNEHLWAFHFA